MAEAAQKGHTEDLGGFLFGKARRRLFALLYAKPEEALYVREIIQRVGGGASSVQQELRRMERLGLLLREKRGNQVYFRANPESPVFAELRSIVRKTFGIVDVVRGALLPFSERIDLAFIFGSVARSEETASSDVDVFVVGDVRLSEIAEAIGHAERELGRHISPTIYGRTEFRERARERHYFVAEVLERAKIYLIGDATKLDALARE